MIDLETIAETRAKELDQNEKEWVEALRQPSFNDFSSYLSDGEIENFVLSFESPVALTVVSGEFLKGYKAGGESPYFDFCEMIFGSTFNLVQGFDFLFRLTLLEKDLGKSWSYEEKFESLKGLLGSGDAYEPGDDVSRWAPK